MVQNVLNLQKVLIKRIQKEKLFRRDFWRTLPTRRYSLQLTSENGPQALLQVPAVFILLPLLHFPLCGNVGSRTAYLSVQSGRQLKRSHDTNFVTVRLF